MGPAVVLLGPRQCGKTTLARSLANHYFDLEQDSERLRLGTVWPQIESARKLPSGCSVRCWIAVKAHTRWEHWRPTVSMFQREDLRIGRFEMICEPKFRPLARAVTEDIKSVSPETAVSLREIEFDDPWDFEEVFGRLHEFARNYPFEPDEEDDLVHITTGSHVQPICLFRRTESRHFPARLVQTSPPKRKESPNPGRFSVIDLDLSRHDKIATRFEDEAGEALTFLKSGIATRNEAFNQLIERIDALDLFERAQLEFVIGICCLSATLSDAGRKLHAASREKRKDNNDADRLRKYLLKCELSWKSIQSPRLSETPTSGPV